MATSALAWSGTHKVPLYKTWKVKVLNHVGGGFTYQQYDYNPCKKACPKVKQCVVTIACHRGQCTDVPLCNYRYCEQRRHHGGCNQRLVRYYHDTRSGKCKRFIYKGCGGNRNRFQNRRWCNVFCGQIPQRYQRCYLPKKTGPCLKRVSRYYFDYKKGKCLKFWYSGCGGNGNNFSSLKSCTRGCRGVIPPPVHKCHQPKVIGPCKKRLLRYWYNKKTNRCERFYFGGCKGNANNFPDLIWCKKKCVKKVVHKCHQPKVIGPCKKRLLRYWYNKKTNRCERFYFGGCRGNANNFVDAKWCMKQCAKPVVNVCRQPKVVGPCRARHQRFWYNWRTNRCVKFFYGGCRGNKNNFRNLASCSRKCVKRPVNKCRLPKAVGPCKGRIERFYYNKFTKKCEKFFYGGCGGNANNFKDLGWCKKACVKRAVKTCRQPKVVGPCKGRFPRFWYNSRTNKCEKFFYGGCGGNANNFKDLGWCNKKCVVNRCHLPKVVGKCGKKAQKYYYNRWINTCIPYHGCSHNGNSFPDLHWCNKMCVKPVDRCKLPFVVRKCNKKVWRYFYSNILKKCIRYKGCPHNGNDFQDLHWCNKMCVNKNKCKLPKFIGNCGRKVWRYYYDNKLKKCIRYLGCIHGGNIFPDLHWCKKSCMRPTKG